MAILFNSCTPEWAWLSNFSPHPVGEWPTLEHAYQASRTLDPVQRHRIRFIQSPGLAKMIASTFDARPGWGIKKIMVMERALRVKFQNPELRQKLIDTGKEELVHLAPWDTFWGKNKEGVGDNMLGQMLMNLRWEFINASTSTEY